MLQKFFLISGFIILSFTMFHVFKSPFYTEESAKKYVIKNFYKFEDVKNDSYKISKYLKPDNLYYYDEITLRMISNKTYQIILWGNRNSILWDFKTDKQIIVNLDYDDDITRNDIIIYFLLNEKK